jgi:hypothetical protein
MKSKIFFLAVILFTGTTLFAGSLDVKTDSEQEPQRKMVLQKSFEPHLRINGYTFYAFDDKVDSYYSNSDYFKGKIKGGFQWGAGLEYMLAPVQSIEISYLRLDTEAPMNYYNNGAQYSIFDVATNYILVGGNRYFPAGAAIEPYAGAQFGLAIFNVDNPDTGRSGNATKFAWGMKAGLNIWASEMIGLKIQTGLNSAVQAAGGSFWFGGGGSGGGISTYSTFYQFYIGGGLVLKVGN